MPRQPRPRRWLPLTRAGQVRRAAGPVRHARPLRGIQRQRLCHCCRRRVCRLALSACVMRVAARATSRWCRWRTAASRSCAATRAPCYACRSTLRTSFWQAPHLCDGWGDCAQASSSVDGTVRIWNVREEKCVKSLMMLSRSRDFKCAMRMCNMGVTLAVTCAASPGTPTASSLPCLSATSCT